MRLPIILTLLLVVSVYAHANPCVDAVTSLVSRPKFLSALKTAGLRNYPLKRGSKIYLLGRGKTAEVYRVVDKSGEEEVFKIYNKYGPSVGRNVLGSSVVKLDLIRLEILRRLELELKPDDRFRIVAGKAISARVLNVESIHGQTLVTIMNQEPGRAMQIQSELNRKVSLLKSLIKRDADFIGKQLAYDEDAYNQDVPMSDFVDDFFSITPRNVVVDDATDEITLIDPK